MSSVSVLGKKWILKEFNNEDVNFYKNQFFVDDIIAKLLSIRKVKKEDVSSFLNPSIKNFLPNPNILLDMKKTTVRTLECIINKEPIGVFGDYDVDGATATAILGRYFNSINQKCEIYIPDRQTEGYGPSEIGFSKLIKKNIKLIFTVDCGTLSFDPIKFAKKKMLTL